MLISGAAVGGAGCQGSRGQQGLRETGRSVRLPTPPGGSRLSGALCSNFILTKQPSGD